MKIYSSAWTFISARYNRIDGVSPFYYFQALRINVSMSGYYAFVSNSSIDTYGYLYNGTFDPYNPTLNLLQRNDDSGGNAQFLINVSLMNTGSYFLVATTYSPNRTASFSVIGSSTAGIITFDKCNDTMPPTAFTGTTTTSKFRS